MSGWKVISGPYMEILCNHVGMWEYNRDKQGEWRQCANCGVCERPTGDGGVAKAKAEKEQPK